MSEEEKKGIVIGTTGIWYTVECEDGSVLDCRIKGKFRIKGIKSTNPVVVGDHVTVQLDGEDGIISYLEDRTNYIIRQSVNLSKQSHILASNIDQCVMVATVVQPPTLIGFIDRILISAESFRIPVILVFNKADLFDEGAKAQQEEWMELYSGIGYKCLVTSAIEGNGMAEFKELLEGRVSLLAGNSGVGKSALINHVAPELDLKTANISSTHDRGTHTTTSSQMHKLPFGGYIIDTPGVKSFGLFDLEKEHLAHYFPEMREQLGACKYPNCVHLNEPHCVVKDMVASGEIAETRYKSYLYMMEGLETGDYRRT